ncbi:MAG: hypothetical protein RR319_09170, partial [Bacteroides sp.]
MKNKNVQLRLRKVFKSIVACSLVVSIMACSLNTLAAAPTEYISEIKFATDDVCSKAEAKKYLTDNGYKTIPGDLGFNDALYVGYKTTTNPKEAITDIAVMNMNGGYSFSEYEELVKEQKQAASAIISDMMYGVREYRANIALGSPAAKYARDMMNTYIEDDSGKLMGDLFLDTSISEDRLATIFMQASGVHLPVIKQNLALACTPYGKDEKGKDKVSWMERLSKLGADGVMKASNDDSNNIRAIVLKEAFSAMVPELQKYLTVQGIIDASIGIGELTGEKQAQALKVIEENYEADKIMKFTDSATAYAILRTFKYDDLYLPEVATLADFVMKAQELESYDFHAMASVLTETEYRMMYLVGVAPFINTVGNNEESWQKIRSEVAAMNLKKPPITSIYQGVDRELFNGKVAMTSESIRKNNMNSDNNLFYGNINEAIEIALFTLMATAGATMIGAGIYAAITKSGFRTAFEKGAQALEGEIKVLSAYSTMIPSEKAFMRKYYPEKYYYKLTNLGKVFFAAMAVLAIVLIVFSALEIAYYYKNDYTTMPLIMMDSVMQKNADGTTTSPVMIKYDAITQQTINIQNNYIADLNTFGGNQWI